MITVDSSSRWHREVASRVELVAEDLGRVVARKLGGRLPRTRILVTDGASMIRAAQQSENQLAGAVAAWRKTKEAVRGWACERHDAACAVYDRDGILVIINSPAFRRHMDKVDQVVIHELTHAVQLSQPGIRGQHSRYQQMRLGVLPHDDQFLTHYVRAMNTREQQARNLEALAR